VRGFELLASSVRVSGGLPLCGPAFLHLWGWALSWGVEGPACWWGGGCGRWRNEMVEKARTAGRSWLACTHPGPKAGSA